MVLGELEPLDDGVPVVPELCLDDDVPVVAGALLAEPFVASVPPEQHRLWVGPPVHRDLKEVVQGPPVCRRLRVQVCQGPQLIEPVPV